MNKTIKYIKIIVITLLFSLMNNGYYGQYLDLDYKDNCQNQVIEYYDNGNIQEIGCYDSQLKNKVGVWSYYFKNGNIESEIHFNSKGLKHGTWKVWDENGVLRASMRFKNGQRYGKWEVWDNRGLLVNSREY